MTRREMEILRNSQPSVASNGPSGGRPHVNIRAVSDLLSEYNGLDRDFGEWKKQIKLLCRTYELDDNMAKILISSRLRGRAAQWLHSRSEYIEMTMEELLERMKSAFDCRPSRMERRKKFESRTWNSGDFCRLLP